MITINRNNSLLYNSFEKKFYQIIRTIVGRNISSTFKSINLSPITRVSNNLQRGNVARLSIPIPNRRRRFISRYFYSIVFFFFFWFFHAIHARHEVKSRCIAHDYDTGERGKRGGMIEEWDGYSVSQCKLKRMAGADPSIARALSRFSTGRVLPAVRKDGFR